jgi:hypothetical protein
MIFYKNATEQFKNTQLLTPPVPWTVTVLLG